MFCTINIYFEIMKHSDVAFWKKLELKVPITCNISAVCDYFWNQFRICFSHVEFFCSPRENVFHRLSKEDQEIPFFLVFDENIRNRRPIEGYFVFRCCYFTTPHSKIFHFKIFYGVGQSLQLKLYSDAKMWFILCAFNTLTNMNFQGSIHVVVDHKASELIISDETLESFVSQNKLPSPLSEETSLSLYFF